MRDRVNVQLLEVTVSNVMAAPIWNSIELDTMRELHLVLFLKPAALFVSFLFPSSLAVCGVSSSLDGRVIDKLELLARICGSVALVLLSWYRVCIV